MTLESALNTLYNARADHHAALVNRQQQWDNRQYYDAQVIGKRNGYYRIRISGGEVPARCITTGSVPIGAMVTAWKAADSSYWWFDAMPQA